MFDKGRCVYELPNSTTSASPRRPGGPPVDEVKRFESAPPLCRPSDWLWNERNDLLERINAECTRDAAFRVPRVLLCPCNKRTGRLGVGFV
ncbi:MAG: hypothetical protein ACLVL7_14760 [Anaerotruncus massiliensis (ex Togo et al. 2019)]